MRSVKKIPDDGFYTTYQQELHDYVVGPLDKVNAAYKASDWIIKGDAEKFYPAFYKCVCVCVCWCHISGT